MIDKARTSACRSWARRRTWARTSRCGDDDGRPAGATGGGEAPARRQHGGGSGGRGGTSGAAGTVGTGARTDGNRRRRRHGVRRGARPGASDVPGESGRAAAPASIDRPATALRSSSWRPSCAVVGVAGRGVDARKAIRVSARFGFGIGIGSDGLSRGCSAGRNREEEDGCRALMLSTQIAAAVRLDDSARDR